MSTTPPIADEAPPPEPDPFRRFAGLLEAAHRTPLADPTTMALATADARGRPSVRMVLLKEFSPEGFVFYTNLGSRKARDLEVNPHAALCIYWEPLETQVRVEGPVVPVTGEEADAYFASRPRGSRIGAWASKQSQALPDRVELLRRVERFESQYPGEEVPRPDFWSGFRLQPERLEFWQAVPSRLHRRDVYTPAVGGWRIEQLYP
jgi:pyridoxamine 5'-phosphate oxidase